MAINEKRGWQKNTQELGLDALEVEDLPRYLTRDDEVLTRQCPCLGLSIHGERVGAWRIRRLQTETWVHTNLSRFGSLEGKDLHPACLILYCLYS
jgi:hypothetical protein